MELNTPICVRYRRIRRFRFILLCICLLFSHADAPALRKPTKSNPFLIANRAIARILNIVVNGTQKDEGITVDEVYVKRANDDPSIPVEHIPAHPGMFLYTMDELATGPGVYVTIVFVADTESSDTDSSDPDSATDKVDTPEKEYQEVLVQEKTAIRISNPQKGKVRAFFGGIMASVYGFFNASSGSGYTIANHTDFEFRINPGGRGDVLVLEGLVTFQSAEFEEPRLGENPGYWHSLENLTVVKNQSSDARRVISVENPCADSQVLNLSPSANISWITIFDRSFSSNVKVNLSSRQKTEVSLLIKFDTKNVAVGSYSGALRVECPDCSSACKPTDLPLRVTVLPEDGIPVPEGMELGFDRLQPIGSPSRASIERLNKAAELLYQIFKVTRLRHAPYVAFDGGLPAFSTIEEREISFRQASIDAVVKTAPGEKAEAYEMLGDVYRSVGEYEKAEHAYVKAAGYDPQRKESRLFAIKRLDAVRGIPGNNKLDEPYLTVAGTVDKREDDRLFTLAHLVMGGFELTQAQDAFEMATIEPAFNQLTNARLFFEHVLSERKSVLSSLSKQERATFWLNYGMVLQKLAVYWLQDDKGELAKTNYAKARRCLAKAKRSDPANPFISVNLSYVLTGLGNIEKYLSQKETGKVRDYYRNSEHELNKISTQLVEARNARVFLQTSQGIPSKFEEILPLTASAMTRGSSVPNVDGMLFEVAAEIIARKGFIPTLRNGNQPSLTTRQCIKPEGRRRSSGAENQVDLTLQPCS